MTALRKYLGILLFLFAATQIPVGGQTPADHLKIFERFVDRNWVGEMKSPDGNRTFKTERHFKIVGDGSILKYAGSIPEMSSHDEGYIYWDWGSHKIAVFILSNRGVIQRGTVSAKKGVVTVQGTIVFPEQTFNYKNTFEFTADGKMIDSWFQNASGSWQPGHVIEFSEQKARKSP